MHEPMKPLDQLVLALAVLLFVVGPAALVAVWLLR